jgi:hypothetical protein
MIIRKYHEGATDEKESWHSIGTRRNSRASHDQNILEIHVDHIMETPQL